MLGRRLLLLATVLLATGAIAAVLTPRDAREPSVSVPRKPPARAPKAVSGGTPSARAVTRTVDASRRRRPAAVRARVGDLLRLTVKASVPDEVELVGLGRFQAVDEFSPARFEFFCQRAGSFRIRLRQSARTIGRLVVT